MKKRRKTVKPVIYDNGMFAWTPFRFFPRLSAARLDGPVHIDTIGSELFFIPSKDVSIVQTLVRIYHSGDISISIKVNKGKESRYITSKIHYTSTSEIRWNKNKNRMA